jgi:uncharacterized damage-inducible protein DinB
MPMAGDSSLRQQLIALLDGGHAHAPFADAIEGFPPDKIGIRPEGLPHSGWELLEHMRLAQEDILRFSQSAEWKSPKFPEGYWPKSAAPRTPDQWHRSIESFQRDLEEFRAMLRDPGQDLHREFPWGDGQTLLREALLIADHNAYHLGQLVLVRRLVGAWPG